MGYSEPMKNFFINNYGFILGFVCGIGFVLFGIEAFQHEKNPLVYIGSFGLMVCSRIVYSALKKNVNSSLNPSKSNEEKSF
jgi:hypothetical protein